MAGGLLQLVSNSTADLFLIGNPQITFYKVVYRRYTNFSIESQYNDFLGIKSFGETLTCNIKKRADLVYKMFLEIKIPSTKLFHNSLPRYDTSEQTYVDQLLTYTTDRELALTNYNKINDYIQYVIGAYKKFKIVTQQDDYNYLTLFQELTKYFNSEINKTEFKNAKIAIREIDSGFYDSTKLYEKMVSIIEDETITNDDIKLELIENLIITIKEKLERNSKNYWNTYKEKLKIEEEFKLNRYNFSWISKLGHYIFEYVSIKLAGRTCVKHTDDFFEINNQLNRNTDHDNIYNKLIGNITELTTYNTDIKDEYTLKIPLQFWCNKTNGLALPLVSLKNCDVEIEVKLKELNNIIKTDFNDVNNELDDLIQLSDIKLLTDYVYLSEDERKKFANSFHEYLIETTEYAEFNIDTPSVNKSLDFSGGTKELIVLIKNSNQDAHDYSQNNQGNPIKKLYLDAIGYKLFEKLDGDYFNYVTPYNTHMCTPSDGINVMSFSRNNYEFQPHGAFNFTIANNKKIFIELDENYVNNNTLTSTIISIRYNVLRIGGGIGHLAF